MILTLKSIDYKIRNNRLIIEFSHHIHHLCLQIKIRSIKLYNVIKTEIQMLIDNMKHKPRKPRHRLQNRGIEVQISENGITRTRTF